MIYVITTESRVSERETMPTLIEELLKVDNVRAVTLHIREADLSERDVRYEVLPHE